MKYIFISLIFFMAFGCSNQEANEDRVIGKNYAQSNAIQQDEELEVEAPRSADPPPPPPTVSEVPDLNMDKGSKLIKNGDLKFEVSDLESSKSKVDTMIKSINAYYGNENFESIHNRNIYTLRIRIPNASFDKTIKLLERGIGVLKSKNITTEDITAQYIDTKIRLDNGLAYLNQYQIILLNAKSIKDILDVQEKIRPIEEEIESRKGQLKYFDDQVTYSTLYLELSSLTSAELANNPSFGTRIINAFHNGIQGFLTFLISMVNLWPLLLIVLFIYIRRKSIFTLTKWRKSKMSEK